MTHTSASGAMQVEGMLLVVGENEAASAWLTELLAQQGYTYVATRLAEVEAQRVAEQQPALVLLIEGRQPAAMMSCCAELRAHPCTASLPIVVVSTHYRRDNSPAWLEAGADNYFCQLFDSTSLLSRVAALLRRGQNSNSSDSYVQMALALLAACAAHRPEDAAHMRRVAALALRLGRQFGLEGPALTQLYFGALLHDLDKIGIDVALLNSPAHLNDAERAVIGRHPEIGAQIVGHLALGAALAPIVRGHHERMDGLGYPDGLVGAEIPWAARVVAVLDAYDAMTSQRAYQPLRSPQEAIAILAAGAGTLWDAEIVRALARLLRIALPCSRERALGGSLAA